MISFGFKTEPKSKPKIQINVHPFIQDSRIVVFNNHIHHWLISFIILSVIHYRKKGTCISYTLEGFFSILMAHGLFYKDSFDFDA